MLCTVAWSESVSNILNIIRKLIGGTESGEVDSIKNGDRALCRYVDTQSYFRCYYVVTPALFTHLDLGFFIVPSIFPWELTLF